MRYDKIKKGRERNNFDLGSYQSVGEAKGTHYIHMYCPIFIPQNVGHNIQLDNLRWHKNLRMLMFLCH